MSTQEEDRWQRVWDDPMTAVEMLADPGALSDFVAHAAELRRAHAELEMLHEATLEHASEIEGLLAVKIDEVEALVVEAISVISEPLRQPAAATSPATAGEV